MTNPAPQDWCIQNGACKVDRQALRRRQNRRPASGLDQADRYLDELHGVCLALATGEMASRPVDLRPRTRKTRAGSHMVYARENADRLDVIRILHQCQDVE